MSITPIRGKRGTTYKVMVYAAGRNRYVTTCPTQREAKVAEAAALKQHRTVRRRGVTLSGYCESWLANLHREASTLDDYQRSINRAIDLLGDKPLKAVGGRELEQLVTALVSCDYAPWTIHKTVQHLRSMLTSASDKGLCDPPPKPGSMPKVDREPVEPLAREKVDELLAASPDYWRPLFLLAVTSGLRRGELFALTLDDFDAEAGTIRVRKGKTRAARRTVHLPAVTVAALQAHTPPTTDERLLFPTPRGKRVHPSNWNRDVASELFASVGLEGRGLHALRHTYASILIASGASAKVVQVMMGHEDITTTLNTYGHLFPDAWGQAAGAVESWYDVTKRRNHDEHESSITAGQPL